ncbi:delta-like protein 4 isoform X2 [Betta splendens]|nr:delta-like protein 4 isoform X2 [Betta splendens]
MGGCRTFFTVCLKNFQTEVSRGDCVFGSVTTPVLGTDSFSIQQDARLRLPLKYTWPGAFSLIIEAWFSPEADPPEGSTRPDSLISSFSIQRQLSTGHDWSEEAQSGARAALRFSYRLICQENYYGDTCSKICAPRDDHFGHYTCRPDGERACVAGWKGDYCDEPICLEGCNEKNGNCTLPGECNCRKGWQGLFCDVCKPHPLCKHGTCEDKWQCTCTEGWGGMYCDQDLNYCTHHKPCANGATCLNTGHGSYTCACLPGFTGVNCESAVRECDRRPCHNGGRCLDSDSGYQCACPKGFEGPRCEHKMLTCAEMPCFHGGTCRETDNGHNYLCECPAGYTGLNCEKRTDRCTVLQCANGGHCVSHGGVRLCSCRSGFSGPRCEVNVDECASGPCANGSTCIDRINDYSCTCPPGTTGRRCDRPADPCAARPCLNGGTCTVGAQGRPACACPAPYDGPQCQSAHLDPAPRDGMSLAAVSLGVGAVAALLLLCMVAVAVRRVRRQRSQQRDSEKMNNVSKADFQKENLISASELKNTNKMIDSVDCPSNKSNHKPLNHYQLDYKTRSGYKDEPSVLDKEENCEKPMEKTKQFSKTYSERPECQISTICSSRDSMYQSVFVIEEEKNECIIATEV